MEINHQTAEKVATEFLGEKPARRLGWGISGFVYLSPDLGAVVKVHRRDDTFERELNRGART